MDAEPPRRLGAVAGGLRRARGGSSPLPAARSRSAGRRPASPVNGPPVPAGNRDRRRRSPAFAPAPRRAPSRCAARARCPARNARAAAPPPPPTGASARHRLPAAPENARPAARCRRAARAAAATPAAPRRAANRGPRGICRHARRVRGRGAWRRRCARRPQPACRRAASPRAPAARAAASPAAPGPCRRSRRGTACRRRPRESAGAVGHRAGEGAAHVAEQLALEQLAGDRGAVDGDERPRGAAAVAWMARATTSLPVPVSPVSSTVASLSASMPIAFCTSRIAAEPPTMFSSVAADGPGVAAAAAGNMRASRAARSSRPIGLAR